MDSYPKSLLYLTHLVIHSDGVIHNKELDALNKMYKYEDIPEDLHNIFLNDIEKLEADELYKIGLEALKRCTRDEQVQALAWIYAIAEIDKTVDLREARFLLYAINATDINLEEIIETSNILPKLS